MFMCENHLKLKLNIKYLVLLFLLVQTFVIGISTYHIESLSPDVDSFLLVGSEFGRGSLPYEYQYENKPPLLFYIFYIFSVITSKNPILLKVLKDLIIFSLILSSIALGSTLDTKNDYKKYSPSLVFLLLIGLNRFQSLFSEYLSLCFLSLACIVVLKFKHDYKFFIVGFLLSITTNLNIGSFIFVVGFILFLILDKRSILNIVHFFVGLLSVHFFIFVLYLKANLFDEYIMAMLEIPLIYSNGVFKYRDNFSELLLSYLNESSLLYLLFMLILVCFLVLFFKTIYLKLLSSNELLILIMINCSILFFYLAKKGYSHHYIYFFYFISFSFLFIKNVKFINIFYFILIIANLNMINNKLPQSFENILHFESLKNNYPQYSAYLNIKNSIDEVQTVFAEDHMLILYYLNKRNESYIAHKGLFDYEEFLNVLIKNNKIYKNEIEQNIKNKPDLLIIKNKNFDDSLGYKNLYKIDRVTSVYIIEK